jgi:hypothetical protein
MKYYIKKGSGSDFLVYGQISLFEKTTDQQFCEPSSTCRIQ